MQTKVLCSIMVAFLVCVAGALESNAAVVYMKNSDKITGTITEDNDNSIVVETEGMGSVVITKEHVDRIETDAAEAEVVVEEPADEWERNVSLGYSKSSGNTQNSEVATKLSLHRKTDEDEFHFQGDTYYSSTNKRMDAQQWNLMSRYALSFEDKSWFNFYKIEVNHDRFANIDYRIVPSIGIGYWFEDTDDFKLMTELGAGAQYTNYRDSTKDDIEPILIPRAYIEKRIIDDARISEDLTLYPSLEDTGKYRLRSETVFTNPISDELSLQLSWVNDYDSDPSSGTKKHDMRFISALTYSF
ncbi:YdiY family protein [Candidatus Omnitrophota bacterium]